MRFYNKILILIFFFLSFTSYAQKKQVNIDSLKILSQILKSSSPDFKKYEANEKFKSLLETAFKNENSQQFPYDSAKNLSVLESPDKKFWIITWGISKEDGSYDYFGYIVFPNNKEHSKKFISLTDNTLKITSPEGMISDNNNWLGAIYYKIILTHYNGKKYYTLLGWKGKSSLTTKKVIDVLSFKANGSPIFGALLFRKNKEKPVRIIFEYSAQSTMLLRYEKQMVHVITKPSHSAKSKYTIKDKNNGKAMKADKKTQPKEKITKTKMILFDRLSPIDPRTSKYSVDLEGQYQFYAPETNILDAFIFTNGKWIFTKDIDARNPPQKKPKINKPPAE
jgi:hypothetical protein